MAEEQKTGLFGLKIRPVQTQEELDALLNPKSKEEQISRGNFNLDKVYGPGAYADIGKEIEKDGLLRPTMAETVSLVYDSFFDKIDKEYSNKIKKIMEDKWLGAFTGILYIPNKGAYIQDDPEIRNSRAYMKESDLVKKLQRNDKSARFVPFGYKIGYMTPKELEKNEFIIGLAGIEGAEKLAEVAGKAAGKYKDNPYLGSFKSIDKPEVRFSAVGSSLDGGDYRLLVDGNNYDVGGYYCSCGVRKRTGGAGCAEK